MKATQQVSLKGIKAIRVPYGTEGRRLQTSVDSLGTKSAQQEHLRSRFKAWNILNCGEDLMFG